MTLRVLVLDAQQRAALAVTRSLGSAGHEVTVADQRRETLAGASRYATNRLTHPSADTAPDAFVDWVEEAIAEHGFEAVVPVTEITTDLLARYRARWPNVRLPLAGIDTIDALSDKVQLYERAGQLGVPTPRSVVVRNREVDLDRAVRQIGFPAVLKPHRSRIRRETHFVSTAVAMIETADELRRALRQETYHNTPFLYQQKVGGRGQGVFALYENGRPIVWFAHRRLREKPPEGGISVLCESCAPDTQLVEFSKRLLDAANWHGAAMVEFKVTESGEPYLMEVNARLWGSLQLSIDAGVDFPRLLLGDIGSEALLSTGYRTGHRLRWFLGDLDRLYILSSRASRYGYWRVLAEWGRFVVPRPFTTRHETFRWQDPKPGLWELRHYVGRLIGR